MTLREVDAYFSGGVSFKCFYLSQLVWFDENAAQHVYWGWPPSHVSEIKMDKNFELLSLGNLTATAKTLLIPCYYPIINWNLRESLWSDCCMPAGDGTALSRTNQAYSPRWVLCSGCFRCLHICVRPMVSS